ncbi:unnamed protein product [Arabidopsis lyrata]|nr:unnamed protein product [Arabidopsis lyrata]
MSFDELLTIPEQDEWVYSDGKSTACVAFILAMYKAAGVFGPLANHIQVTEFTIRDAYTPKLFESNQTRLPSWCNTEEEKLDFCQILELFDYEALCAKIDSCDGVFHTASPMTDDPETMLEPAVNGAKFVIDAAAKAKFKPVVFTSSIGLVYINPNRDPQAIVDENCWSDLDFCKNTKNWYCYGKMVVEQSAWETAKEKGVDLLVN